jgi:hypothetical protein
MGRATDNRPVLAASIPRWARRGLSLAWTAAVDEIAATAAIAR